jgi:hypothetical protein
VREAANCPLLLRKLRGLERELLSHACIQFRNHPKPLTATSPHSDARPRPLLELELDPSAFTKDWRHCDLVANYLSRLASFDRTDTFFYSNLLSTVLNELMEIAFFKHHPAGPLTCKLLRSGPVDRVELLIPVNDASRSFYERAVEEAQSSRAAEAYAQALLGEDRTNPALGLLELASDYGASIRLEPEPESARLRLSVEVRLEEIRISQPPAAS